MGCAGSGRIWVSTADLLRTDDEIFGSYFDYLHHRNSVGRGCDSGFGFRFCCNIRCSPEGIPWNAMLTASDFELELRWRGNGLNALAYPGTPICGDSQSGTFGPWV